jgi:hypothetical protein
MSAVRNKISVPHDLSDAYEGLLTGIQTAGDSANCGPVYSSMPLKNAFNKGTNADEANFDCVIYLKGWKWRGSSHTTATIDILVKVQEILRLRPTLQLNSSTVRVSYFETVDQIARLRGSIHYDHIYPPQDDQHPSFHAQLDNHAVEPEGEVKAYFRYTVEPSKFDPFNHVRIPTADMTLSSVFLCLAADHLPRECFAGFKKKFLELQDRLPHPIIDDLRWSFNLGAGANRPIHLKSSHWYTRKPTKTS